MLANTLLTPSHTHVISMYVCIYTYIKYIYRFRKKYVSFLSIDVGTQSCGSESAETGVRRRERKRVVENEDGEEKE